MYWACDTELTAVVWHIVVQYFYHICSFDLRSLYLDYPATAAIDFTPYLKFDHRLVTFIVNCCCHFVVEIKRI